MTSMGKVIPTLATLMTLSMFGCSSNNQTDLVSFENYLSNMGLSSLSAKDKALEKTRFEQQQLLLDYIEKTGSIDTKEIDVKLARIRSDMLLSQFFEKRYEQEITPDAIARYYESHQDEFTVKERRLAHILLKIPASANQQERDVIHTTAQEILARLHSGEEFSALAKAFSQDTKTADSGGDLGWAGPGILSEVLRDASDSISVDSTPIVVEADYGLHIVNKLAQSREQPLSLSHVRPRVIKALRATVKAAEMKRVVKQNNS